MSDSNGMNTANSQTGSSSNTTLHTTTNSQAAATTAQSHPPPTDMSLTFIGSGKNNEGDQNSASNSTSSKEGMMGIESNAFGFNFDSEEGNLMNMNIGNGTSPPFSEGGKSPTNPNDAVSTSTTLNSTITPNHPAVTSTATTTNLAPSKPTQSLQGVGVGTPNAMPQAIPASSVMMQPSNDPTHEAAAATAVANLQTIASQSVNDSIANGSGMRTMAPGAEMFESSRMVSSVPASSQKRKASSVDSNNGYNSDDERSHSNAPVIATAKASHLQLQSQSQALGEIPVIQTSSSPTPVTSTTINAPAPVVKTEPAAKKKKKMDDSKREERNAREKERSFRISKQINELRNLLSSGGVIVPKGTKSSVLTEAANYIKMLQNQQYRSEIDRQQLVQQIQMIGGGQLGPEAQNVVKHVAAQNGVWSLGNFGGMPPRSAMMQPQQVGSGGNDDKLGVNEYRHIFNTAPIAMAIASMGGAFIECNILFTQLSQFTKQQVCSMTVFNLTAKSDLQPAFEKISEMISPKMDRTGDPPSCVFRGAMKQREDIGLHVTLIKGDDNVAKNFCVTLIKNPTGPFDMSKPIPATQDMLHVSDSTNISAGEKGGVSEGFMNISG